MIDHSDHGRGTKETGPDGSDCGCRTTEHMISCAVSGCGFCRAQWDYLNAKAKLYHTIHGENATIEGCPCCFP